MSRYFLFLLFLLVSGCFGRPQDPGPSGNPSGPPRIVEVNMTANSSSFDPGMLSVKKGDHLRIRITVPADDVRHGFALSAFGISEELPPGQTTLVEFVADKAGAFTYMCNLPCGPGHYSMKGTLTVEEG